MAGVRCRTSFCSHVIVRIADDVKYLQLTRGYANQTIACGMEDMPMSIDDELIRRFKELLENEDRWHTVEDFSKLVGVNRGKFTVRQWCNLGRINARHSMTRCGRAQVWRISHKEYLRYQRDGLLPMNPNRNHPDGDRGEAA
jgi:hypothetical protein